ncbi:MAG: site-specific integrase [Acidobacteria bacterium]|nr:site-specific integrase [Acidobacteriota bacterium]
MATIRKRTRYRATLKIGGSPIATRTFAQEDTARSWLRGEKRRLVREGQPPATLDSDVGQSTSYQAIVRLRRHPAQYATFNRLTDAKKWAGQTEAAIREGRHFRFAEAKRHSVGDLIDRYRGEILERRPLAKREDQERHLAWWQKRIGSYSLADVTPALISEHREFLSRGRTHQSERRSPATCNRYLTSLSHAFSIARREWEWIDRNPVAQVRKLPEPRGRVRFLSDEERERLLESCRESSDLRLFLVVVLAISTGARKGELLRLRWPDIDLRRGVAVLHQTKNDERRALPLTGLALDVLSERFKIRRLDTDLVFANSDGKPTFPRKAWAEALRAAQIEDFRFHDCRHSAASYLAMSGATLAEIAEVLGHKTLAMVKRYSHLTDQHTSKVVARMNEKIFGGF